MICESKIIEVRSSYCFIGNYEVLYLGGPLGDGKECGITPVSLNRAFHHVAVTAVDLRYFRGNPLGHRRPRSSNSVKSRAEKRLISFTSSTGRVSSFRANLPP
jgi:hypothetical protein